MLKSVCRNARQFFVSLAKGERLLIEVHINNFFNFQPSFGVNEAFRDELREKLGIVEYLKKRQIWHLEQSGVHCEYYLAKSPKTAPCIVFLPGIGTYSELYAEFLAKLAAQGYNVFSIDFPGHGYSAGSRGRYTVNDVVVAVQELLDKLEQEEINGSCGIFGYSVGSLLGLAVTEADERIRSLLCFTLLLPDIPPDMLYDLGWWWTRWNSYMFPFASVPLSSFIDFNALMRSHPAGDLINKDPLIVLDYPLSTLSSIFSYHSRIINQDINVPITILHGDRDEVLPLAYSQTLVAKVVQPIELSEISNVGHMMPWLNTDELVKRTVSWFAAM
ncbi:MAG: alpha/beta hydrolase [Pontibacterium sp.]